MNHLSEADIFSYIDRQMSSSAVAREIETHCASCAPCRQRLEFHRALARGASEPLAGLLPHDFAERVMRRARVPQHAPRFSWLLRNSANLIAMAVVLAVLVTVGYLSAPVQDAPDAAAGSSVYTAIMTVWNNLSSSITSAFTKHAADTVTPTIVSQSKKVFGNIFWLGAAAFLILAMADRLRHRLKMPDTLQR